MLNPLRTALNQGLLLYGNAFPYHSGKWRIIEKIADRLHLDRLYHGKSFIVRRRGITWKLNPDDLVQRSVYYCSYHEAKETRQLTKLIKPDWTFLDVGSFFGYYSLLVSHLTRDHATVHAFEPFHPNYELLLEHKRFNGFANLHAHKIALSDQHAEVEFQIPLPTACQGVGWLLADGDQQIATSSTELVPTTTLDAFVAQHELQTVDFIKIDTEGAEVKVLRGAQDTLTRFRPSLMLEVYPEGLSRFGADADTLLRLIRELGYSTYAATRAGLESFTDFCSRDEYCNVFCFPVEGREKKRGGASLRS